MNQRQSDFEWLQQFARAGNQSAFRDLVRRHIDLVFATAMRKVGDAGGAEEISQNVFAALARKAWQFAPDDSLPAWLHKTTLLESKSWLRGEMRRRSREQTAAELGTTMNTSDEQPAIHALVPLLDEAMLSLRDKDRTALLLRYYESQSLKAVGQALGISDDTAQKRVQTALEKLSEFFRRRGFKMATVAVTASALQQAASSAPAATVSVVLNSALKVAPPALSGLSALLTRFATLTKLQTAAVCLVITTLPVAWQRQLLQHENESKVQLASQRASTHSELLKVQTEIESLHQTSSHLQQTLADAALRSARRSEVEQKFEAWKKQLRERLLAADFQWTDDCPFVRIPKSALRDLTTERPISPPGDLSQPARELLGLTPIEREQIESALHQHFSTINDLIESRAYETNQARRLQVPADALTSKVFVLPKLGDQARASAAELRSAMSDVLGSDRWQLVSPLWDQQGTPSLRQTLNLDSSDKDQEMAIWISEANGKLIATYAWAAEGFMRSSPGTSLEMFLPDADNRVTLPDGSTFEQLPQDYLGIADLALPIKTAILDWLRQQAATRLPVKGNP